VAGLYVIDLRSSWHHDAAEPSDSIELSSRVSLPVLNATHRIILPGAPACVPVSLNAQHSDQVQKIGVFSQRSKLGQKQEVHFGELSDFCTGHRHQHCAIGIAKNRARDDTEPWVPTAYSRRRVPPGCRLCPAHAPPLPLNVARYRSATGNGQCHGHNASGGCSLSISRPAGNAVAACVSSPASRHQPSLNGFSSTSALMPGPSIRHIRAGRRRRAIAWSDCCVLFVNTRATVQGRAGFGLRRDAPAIPGERGRFTRLNHEGSGRRHQMAASICAHRPGFSSLRRFRS